MTETVRANLFCLGKDARVIFSRYVAVVFLGLNV